MELLAAGLQSQPRLPGRCLAVSPALTSLGHRSLGKCWPWQCATPCADGWTRTEERHDKSSTQLAQA